jgi:hypothetical protein
MARNTSEIVRSDAIRGRAEDGGQRGLHFRLAAPHH